MEGRQRCALTLYLLLISLSFTLCEHDDADAQETADYETEDEFVLTLTTENFDEAVDKNPTLLVVFEKPCCEICKTLAPMFAAAAKELVENDLPVALARVDTTVHTDLAERFEIVGHPTLRFFKNGKHYVYDGFGQTEHIVAYMKKIAHPDWEPEPEVAITLTRENFDEIVNAESLMLVQFYTLKCDPCKKLAPVYEQAAQELKKDSPPILLGKVDASVETELAAKYNITAYPTLKIFKKGRAVDFKEDYTTAYDIMYCMKRQVRDATREIKNARMLRNLLVPDEISVVGFFDSPENPKVHIYKDLAVEIRNDFSFGITFNEDLRKSYNISPNSVVIFTGERFHTKYEPKWYSMEIKDETTSDDIFDFLRDHHLPLVGQYLRPLTNHYDKKRPLCLVFYSVDFSFDHKDATQFWRHKIADVAHQFPDITFAIVDDEEEFTVLQQFGLDESGEAMNIGLYGTDGKKYAMEPMEEFDVEHIVGFLNRYKQGKLTPFVKSQRPPAKQTGPITVVVGETFDQIVKDPSKDVLIELYSPWCAPCLQLESTLEILAKKLSDSNLILAKIDATANDLPDNYTASNYPTVYFATAANKDSPVKFEGARPADDVESFLREHAVVSMGKSKKEEL
ncbi:unnamed protein product [Candidula unifasciata]|uniref:protein disulfide-isomerase n=1 Tax=Candidula unifasciata TaxID=100452 RepID=A0A8S3Z9N6_9EUPU|nr:unnamed protein product [Candidula unifasciata]